LLYYAMSDVAMHISGRVEYDNHRRDPMRDWYLAVIISCLRFSSVVLGMPSMAWCVCWNGIYHVVVRY
jgi:hypothetical protein